MAKRKIPKAKKEKAKKEKAKKEKAKKEKRKGEVSIIVPTARSIDTLEACLQSIRLYTEIPYEIIIMINSPYKGFREKALRLINMRGGQEVALVVKEYLGFVRACNMSAEVARGQNIIILNDDVRVGYRWAKRLLSPFHDPNVGATGAKVLYHDGDFHCKNYGKYKYAECWCMATRKEIIKRLGLFDTNLEFSYCEDADFAMKLQENGYDIKQVAIPILHHGQMTTHGTKTLKKKCMKSEKKNREYLIKKWGEK